MAGEAASGGDDGNGFTGELYLRWLWCIPLGSVLVNINEDLTRISLCNTSLSRP